MIRASSGISSPVSPSGYPAPSQRSWWERTIRPTWRMNPPTPVEHLLALDGVGLDDLSTPVDRACPGLLMISLGIAILPTSCSSAANSRFRRCSALSSSCSPSASASRDDALAVLAGVAVVGFDDVPEDERGSAIRVVELEQTLAGARWRSRANTARSASSGSGASAATGNCLMSSALTSRDAQTAPRRWRRPKFRAAGPRSLRPGRIAVAHCRGGEVDEELRRERADEQRRTPALAGSDVRERKHGHRADREPRVADRLNSRLVRILPANTSGRRPIASATRTAIGTIATGIANSNGTNASCVADREAKRRVEAHAGREHHHQ